MFGEVIEILLFTITLILSGLYSGSEAVLFSLSIDRTRQLIIEGGRKGRALEFVARHPQEMLTTILVGNNLVNIFAASYTTSIAQRYFQNDALAISVGFTTVAILLFGEIIPKTFARNHAERLAFPVVRILQLNYYLFYPVVQPLTWMISKLLGKNAELSGRLVTIDDIEFMVNKAGNEKTIDSKQLDLLSSILEFPTIKVKDIMIARTKVNHIESIMSFKDVMGIIKESNHSRYPVCEKDLDHTVGFLHVKDLVFTNSFDRKAFNILNYVKPPFFVYEHMKIQAVFDHMNRKKVHLALVKNENGLVVGIVTLEDIMEEIFGEIHDEHDVTLESSDKEGMAKTEAGLLVEGVISLRDLYNEYDIKIPLNDNYSTLSGFIMDIIGNNFPKKGMMIFWEGITFKLQSVEQSEIKQVLINDVEGDLKSEKNLQQHENESNKSSS